MSNSIRCYYSSKAVEQPFRGVWPTSDIKLKVSRSQLQPAWRSQVSFSDKYELVNSVDNIFRSGDKKRKPVYAMNIYKNILPNGYIAKVPLTFESSLKYQSSEDFFQPCMHLIKELASLEENWDAHNGEAISKTVITNAERLLMNMRSLPAPDIIPSPDSTLSFAWDGENGWAQIDIGNNSFAVYVELNNEVLVKADRLPYNDPAQIEKFAAYIAKIDTQD